MLFFPLLIYQIPTLFTCNHRLNYLQFLHPVLLKVLSQHFMMPKRDVHEKRGFIVILEVRLSCAHCDVCFTVFLDI